MIQLCRAEVLREMSNFLKSNRTEGHSTDCLKERGEEKRGRRQSVFNRISIDIVSRETLRRLLRDGAEYVRIFLSNEILSKNWKLAA